MTPEKPRHDGECKAAVLSCPFCESAARLVHPHDSSMGYVLCGGCYASSMPSDDNVTVRLWNTRPALGTQEGELPVRCPKCRMNWQAFPPSNHDDLVVRSDGSTRFEKTNGYRCVECKSEYRAPLALASHARTIEALRAAVNSFLAEYIVAHDTDANIRTLEHAAETLARTLKEHPNGL